MALMCSYLSAQTITVTQFSFLFPRSIEVAKKYTSVGKEHKQDPDIRMERESSTEEESDSDNSDVLNPKEEKKSIGDSEQQSTGDKDSHAAGRAESDIENIQPQKPTLLTGPLQSQEGADTSTSSSAEDSASDHSEVKPLNQSHLSF